MLTRRTIRLPRPLACLCAGSGAALLLAGSGASQEPAAAPAQMTATEARLAPQGERLVPAAMNLLMDRAGNSWNLEENGSLGRVGNSMVNSGLVLLVNNQQFQVQQAMMTVSGDEFVLLGRAGGASPGLHVMRRVKLLEREGALRYLEVLNNASANPAAVSVALRTNFSGNYKTYLTDLGNSGALSLGERESAVLVTPGSNQANRAFVFTLSSPRAELKPAISSQNKYGLTFHYNLTIPAGEAAILAHVVAQLPTPREFDRQALARVFRPFSLDALAGAVPRELGPLVANGDASRGTGGALPWREISLDELGVERGRRDVLAMGERTRLPGAAAGERLRVETGCGEALVDFAAVAAVEGGDRGRRGTPRVHLRDGQILSGTVAGEGLSFAMASGGQMALEVESLDLLVRAREEGEGQWGEDVVAMVETHEGDRLAARAGDQLGLRAMTPWGGLAFSAEDLLWLGPAEEGAAGHVAEFRDGTRCHLFLGGEPLELRSGLIEGCRVAPGQIRAIVTRAGLEGAAGQNGAPASAALVKAAGGQQIAGEVTASRFQVLTRGEAVEVAPGEIRRLVNASAEEGSADAWGSPMFRLELWSGGTVTGRLAETELEMTVRGAAWRVPFSDIVELETAAPALTEETRSEIERLIAALGAEDWERRERATEELASLGSRVHGRLREELRGSPDPETRRRVERVLLGIP